MQAWTELELIEIRRTLHQIPEIGMEEHLTRAYLLEKIAELPQERLRITCLDTAILVNVVGENSERRIGWRTDMDGLPISEDAEVPFASSIEGNMHACGHDIHMTIALGLLQRCVMEILNYDVVFFFQPAEENQSGAQIYYDNGFIDEYKPDYFFGLHVHPDLPVGTIASNQGALFAGACAFTVRFIGKEGHAAYPHQANDMIVASSLFVQQVQTIISRNINPMEGAVITFGEYHAGIADNVIAGEAMLTGTIRALTHATNDLMLHRFQEIAQGIGQSFGCQAEVSFDQKGYIPVVNDPKTTSFFKEVLTKNSRLCYEDIEPSMTAEDFGYLLKHIPGTMFWLGVNSEHGLHHPKFNPDESAIHLAVSELFVGIKAWVNQM